MCRPASFILTRDRAYWSRNTDSHEDIIKEHELHADGAGGPNILRVEIVAPDGDMRLPLAQWQFGYDQDTLPEWADAARDEARTRKALTEWAAAKLVLAGSHEAHGREQLYLFDSARAELYDSASAKLFDSARAVLHDSASLELYNSASAKLYNLASAVLHDSASAKLFDSARAVLYDSARAELYNSASLEETT